VKQALRSALEMRAASELKSRGLDYVFIDIPGESGEPGGPDEFYKPILWRVFRTIGLKFDLTSWWDEVDVHSMSQRIKEFFRDIVSPNVQDHIVIFLDEVGSTSALPFADDPFLAIRAMYIERSLVPQYNKISFCLIGREHPARFIKRSVKYDIGRTIELRDFDVDTDDLSELATFLGNGAKYRWDLLERILYWTGGQPYLTVKLCMDMRTCDGHSSEDVDRLVEREFRRVEIFTEDTHFYDIARIVGQIITKNEQLKKIYISLFDSGSSPGAAGKASNDLKKSGLVKRDHDGGLIIRNRIYAILFDPRSRHEAVQFQPGVIA
jgi:hypothetical protein